MEHEEHEQEEHEEQEDVRQVTLQLLLQQTVMLLVQEQFLRQSHHLLLFLIRLRRRCLCASSTSKTFASILLTGHTYIAYICIYIKKKGKKGKRLHLFYSQVTLALHVYMLCVCLFVCVCVCVIHILTGHTYIAGAARAVCRRWGSTRLCLQCPLHIENTFYREQILESLQGLVCPLQCLPSPLPTAEAKMPLRRQKKRKKKMPSGLRPWGLGVIVGSLVLAVWGTWCRLERE